MPRHIVRRNLDQMERLQASIAASMEVEPERQRLREQAMERREDQRRHDRRTFLRRAAMAGAGAALLGGTAWRPAQAASAPRVVIVGAGNAGMTAAWRMWNEAGWVPRVFEARERVGGRTWTNKTYLSGGQWIFHGGESVNTNELADHQPDGIGALADELQLGPFMDALLNYPNGRQVQYYFDGSVGMSWGAFNEAVRIAKEQISQCVLPFTYDNKNAMNIQLDSMSMLDWINEYVPGGTGSDAGSWLAHGWTGGFFGGHANDTSAYYPVVWLASPPSLSPFPPETYDERWLVPGGSDNITKTILAKMPAGTVTFGKELLAVKRNTDNTYTCTFGNTGGGESPTSVTADRVVVAVPTGRVIQEIDFSQAGLSARKLASFQQPNGTNVKINLQFSDQVWGLNNASGAVASDTVIETGWQQSFISSDGTYTGTPGDMAPPVQVVFNNTSYPNLPAHGPLTDQNVINQILAVDDVLWDNPSASSHFLGRAWMDNWPADPQARGSYAYYRPGQMSAFAMSQAEAEGGIHFAGEHTAAFEQIGTMNGAVTSGERVAREILAAYGIH